MVTHLFRGCARALQFVKETNPDRLALGRRRKPSSAPSPASLSYTLADVPALISTLGGRSRSTGKAEREANGQRE